MDHNSYQVEMTKSILEKMKISTFWNFEIHIMAGTSLQNAGMKKNSRFSGFSDSVDIARKNHQNIYSLKQVMAQNFWRLFCWHKCSIRFDLSSQPRGAILMFGIASSIQSWCVFRLLKFFVVFYRVLNPGRKWLYSGQWLKSPGRVKS